MWLSSGVWRVFAASALLALGSMGLGAGCTFEVLGLEPGAAGGDDLAIVGGDDLSVSGDLANVPTVDLAGIDLANADLTPAPDLATPPDMTPPSDLATPPDMTPVAVLSCTVAATPAKVDLSAVGTTDWVQFGRTITETRNEKSGAAAIGSLSSNPAQRFSDGEVDFSWSNGDPTQNESGTHTGFYYYTATFSLPVVASETTTQRLRVYVGGSKARGRFTASLPGAQGCLDTTQKDENNGWNVTYTILYRAAAPGQTLTVTWEREESFDTFGNVRFEAAALDPAP